MSVCVSVRLSIRVCILHTPPSYATLYRISTFTLNFMLMLLFDVANRAYHTPLEVAGPVVMEL